MLMNCMKKIFVKKVLVCLMLLLTFVSSAWGRAPDWMLKEVTDFISLCSSATADEIETELKKLYYEEKRRVLYHSNGNGESALSAALLHNPDPDIAEVLIKYGANPYNALKFAIEEKNREATAVILKTFPEVLNELGKKESFATFCRVAPYAMIEAKLKDGAFPNGRGFGSVAPLHAAAEDNPDPSVLKLLIDYGAEPNSAAMLHHASVSGNIGLINSLLKSGVKVDSKTKSGITALMAAASQTAYYLCCNRDDDYPEKLAVEGIKALIKAGANVNEQDQYGDTALKIAAGRGRSETVKTLINARANVNIQSLDGKTALISAASSRNPNPEIIIALLNAGAKTNFKDSNGKRAIDYARQAESLAGTEAFLRLVRESR